MICQKCGTEKASVYLSRIVDGQKTEYYLCEKCAQQQGEYSFDKQSLSLHNFFSDFIGEKQGEKKATFVKGMQQCPHCGLSLNYFREKGRLGCGECYQVFATSLTPLIKRIHSATVHTGKVPQHSQQALHRRRQISNLRQELQQAVKMENYEKAAQLRDQIKSLEQAEEG